MMVYFHEFSTNILIYLLYNFIHILYLKINLPYLNSFQMKQRQPILKSGQKQAATGNNIIHDARRSSALLTKKNSSDSLRSMTSGSDEDNSSP
jgi:hypothetical protein